MSERTCEIDGKIFEGIPCHEDAESLCQGCAGDDNPDVCDQLGDCWPTGPRRYGANLPGYIIWIAQGTQSTRVRTGTIVTSVPARKGWAFGVLVNTNALWVGAHYSNATKRWCINVLPCLTVWFTKRGGDAPVRSKL